MCEPFQVLPFKAFPRYSKRLTVSKHNQPEFSPSRKSRLEEVHPYPFSYSFSVLCYLSITLPINHNPHLHSNTPTPFPTSLRRDLPLGVGSILSVPVKRIPNTVDYNHNLPLLHLGFKAIKATRVGPRCSSVGARLEILTIASWQKTTERRAGHPFASIDSL